MKPWQRELRADEVLGRLRTERPVLDPDTLDEVQEVTPIGRQRIAERAGQYAESEARMIEKIDQNFTARTSD